MRLPSAGIDTIPIPLPLQRAGPGHFLANGVIIPIRGLSTFQIVVRTTEFDEVYAEPVKVLIR
jgi:hypothetical protein